MIKLIEIFTKLTNNVLVVDVESTCETKISEIIEIGICDTNFKITESILIKPIFSEINSFCTSLTTITNDDIKKFGKNIDYVYDYFNQVCGNYSEWASYGEYDKKMFDNMSQLYNKKIMLPNKHINVRRLFADKIMKSDNPSAAPRNPKDALEFLGMSFVGVNHRGIDDAKNIAILLNVLLNNNNL